MMKFKDLEFQPHSCDDDGVHALAFFGNGRGASVVRFTHSYGGGQGLYELAVLDGDMGESRIDYTTPITEDVVGYCSEDDITRLLSEIAALPPEGESE